MPSGLLNAWANGLQTGEKAAISRPFELSTGLSTVVDRRADAASRMGSRLWIAGALKLLTRVAEGLLYTGQRSSNPTPQAE